MILKQYYLGCLARASYLIADEDSGLAAVVDPQRDVEQYTSDAARLGCRIAHVFLTHFHADFLAGHLELRDREGATIHLGARARADYAFTPMSDGSTVCLGGVRLAVLETPGHSPESVSIVVYDREQGDAAPHAVLTGDTLFIGDVGRPDLRASLGWSAHQLAGLLYESLHGKLAHLPGETLVYPAHGAGSLCGKNLSTDTVSTIGIQRRFNYALQPMTREQFIEMVTAELPDAPPYFTYDAVMNARERPTLEQALARELNPLSVERALALERGGAQLLDTRDPAQFEAAHMRGSLNIGLGGSYATWCGTIFDRELPIVLIAEPGRELEAATRLGRIGFDTIAGYLAAGMEPLARSPELIDRTPRITVGSLAERLHGRRPPLLIDVRTPPEYKQRRIDGAINLPLNRLRERLGSVAAACETVVYCATGYRSAIAASLMLQARHPAVVDLVGGLGAWDAARLPVA
ncbi:MAG: MBL fold metallo-hydrolase [Solirubrobacterales bacterium]|nr:MBL fold metallo-hydrolase [Solirubrobacterales bacterium]MBV9715290.1 MBL fold metallo-hydrolase [Solirubrobacterales bacterium]